MPASTFAAVEVSYQGSSLSPATPATVPLYLPLVAQLHERSRRVPARLRPLPPANCPICSHSTGQVPVNRFG